ncbi:MAG: hypothetical protein E7613_07950 [Ruminococcaceae bacterium]|nr:hypothetical protein [Oscillospiraceae bacterium]
MKKIHIKYDPDYRTEHSVEALHIYIPTEIGYIDHTYGHTVWKEANADIWRLSVAYMCDDSLENAEPITIGGEWDMALRLADRPDFIGGHAHGDERFSKITFVVDGAERDIKDFVRATEIDSLKIVEDSIGFDPLDGKTLAIEHHKEYTVSLDGIRLDQRVKWLGDFPLNYCYMAMMPPAKKYTDSFYTNLTEPCHLDIASRPTVDGATSVTVFGKESGLYFTMKVNEYSIYGKPKMCLRDNAGGAYNKMYFDFTSGGEVKKGDIWETFTEYKIEKK